MLDSIDRKIVTKIQNDGKISYDKLGKEVGLSISAVNERLKKLIGDGVIKDYVGIIDPIKVGLHICAFVQVLIEIPETEDDFIAEVSDLGEVQECHCITGEYSYLLKVRAVNAIELDKFLREKIKSIKGVVRTNTIIALDSNKESTFVEVPVSDHQED